MAFSPETYVLARNATRKLLNSVGAFKTKGSVATSSDLPASSDVGDLYIAQDTGTSYVWDGTQWVQVASTSVTDDGAGNVTVNFGG